MTATEPRLSERQILVDKLRRWGDITVDAILDPACLIFTSPVSEGLIGYRIESNAAIVFGEPVCPESEKTALAKAFEEFCRKSGLKVIYAIVSEQFVRKIQNPKGSVLVEFGEKLIFHPSKNPMDNTGPKAVLLRKKVKHATKDGIEIKEYLGGNPALEAALEQVGASWLESRRGAQVYIGKISFFADRHGKRWFYAQRGDQIIGILLLNQLQAQGSWLLNNVMITQNAPNGTSELLVVSALKALKEEGCEYVLCGPVPAKSLEKIEGLGRFSTWITQKAYGMAKRIFRLEGHGIFWEKLQPASEPSFILFNQKQIPLRSVRGLMRALNVSL